MSFPLKCVILMAALIAGLSALPAQSSEVTDKLTKVTIAVDGMMKSKTGAT